MGGGRVTYVNFSKHRPEVGEKEELGSRMRGYGSLPRGTPWRRSQEGGQVKGAEVRGADLRSQDSEKVG